MNIRELFVTLGIQVDKKQMADADRKIDNLKTKGNSLVNTFTRVAGVVGLAFTFNQVIRMVDAIKEVEARVRLTTSSMQEQKMVLNSLYDVAQQTRQEYTSTADLYSRVAANANELKKSQQEILAFTQDVNNALVIGGASTGENSAAILQLGQALSSGRLQGDELRSILENSRRLSRALADGLGVTIGQLREMGKNGELTAETVFNAIRSQSAKLAQEFANMPVTFGQATTVLQNSVARFLSRMDKAVGLSDKIAKGILKIAKGIDYLSAKSNKFVAILKIASIMAGYLYIRFKWTAIIAATLRATQAFRSFITIMMLSRNLVGVLGLIRIGLVGIRAALISTGVGALLVGIIFLLEDIYYWITGGKSALGQWLGDWATFKSNVIKWLDEMIAKIQPFINLINNARESVNGFFSNWRKPPDPNGGSTGDPYDPDNPNSDAARFYKLGTGGSLPTGQTVANDTTNNVTKTNNINVDSSATIGTINVSSTQEANNIVNGTRNNASTNLTKALQFGGAMGG